MAVLVKDPDARLDYAVDWSDYLDAGEIIATSEWLIMPADELETDGDMFGEAITSVTLAGGVVRHLYLVTNRITTSLGRMDDRSLTIRVQER